MYIALLQAKRWTTRPELCNEYPPLLRKSEQTRDIFFGKCPITVSLLFTATAYLSTVFRGSRSQTSTSPTAASHISQALRWTCSIADAITACACKVLVSNMRKNYFRVNKFSWVAGPTEIFYTNIFYAKISRHENVQIYGILIV